MIEGEDIPHLTTSTASMISDHPMSGIDKTHEDTLVYHTADFAIDYKNDDVVRACDEDTGLDKGLSVMNSHKRPVSRSSQTVEFDCEEVFAFAHKIASDSNDQLCKLILDWISHVLQYGNTGIAIVLVGEMGIGKATRTQFLVSLLSEEYCCVDEGGARLGSQFNSHDEG